MKFLVLGCNGMAGHMISIYLKNKGHKVIGFARSKSRFVETIIGDATDTILLEKIIKSNDFDSVVNCIGLLNNFAEMNKDLAVFLNSYLPYFLVKKTENRKTQVIHMSTDCVFSGERGSYTEEDFPDGNTFYDRSKALGEINDLKNVTLRNSIIGPDIKSKGIGLLNWFLQQEKPVKGFTESIWTGQTTLQLAKTIEFVAKERAYGLFNAVPDESISKYELLKLFNLYFNNNKLIISPIKGVKADKSLKRTNFSFDFKIPNYEIMIKELSDWMKQNKAIYPHYKLL